MLPILIAQQLKDWEEYNAETGTGCVVDGVPTL